MALPGEPPPERRPRRPFLGLVVGLLLAVGAGKVFYTATDDELGAASGHRPSPVIGRDELVVAAQWRRFEDVSEAAIEDYLDKDVAAEEWVASAKDRIAEMESAVIGIRTRIHAVQDHRNRADVRRWHRIASDQLEALIELRRALARLDADGERAAFWHLSRVTLRLRRFHQELLARDGVIADFPLPLPSPHFKVPAAS